MAGALLAGLSSKALGASKMVGGASKVAGASKGIGIMPKTFGGFVTRSNIVSSLTGGSGGGKGGISPSKFSSTSTRSKIGNIAGSVGGSGGSGGIGDMLTSESIMGRRTGQDTTQDFLNTFGSDKTGKVIRSSLMVLRDTFVETFETARILRTALNQTEGLGGGKKGKGGKKSKGLLGKLGSMLTSPLGLLGAGVGGGILAKKFGGLKGLKGLFGGAKNASKVTPKALKPAKEAFGLLPAAGQTGGSVVSKVDDAAKVVGKSDDAAKAGLNLGKNFNNVKKSVGQGLKGAKNVGGDLLQKGSKFAKNPKKALGALAIGGLGFLGVKALTGGGGNKEKDVVTKLDSVLDKWGSALDDEESQEKSSGTEVSTSSEATLQGGKVTSGSMSQADADKAKRKLELGKSLFQASSKHGRNSPEYNEIRKQLMILDGTPEEAIYTDKKGNLRTKGYSTYDGKTTVSGGKKQKRLRKGGSIFGGNLVGSSKQQRLRKDGGNKKGGGFGLKRMIGGGADLVTGGMFDFDKQNRKGAPKDYGIRRIAGGLADWATMGMTDFDKRGRGMMQFNPLFGGKDKAWGDANEQAKRGEEQSGFGLKRGIGGALDFATLGMFDFDKQNRSGAPKGFGIKRIVGGLADFVTAGATDFDKRGTGIGQMNLGEKMSKKKAYEKYLNSNSYKNRQAAISNLETHPLDRKSVFGNVNDGKPISQRELYALAKSGDPEAIKMVEGIANIQSKLPEGGSYTWNKETTLSNNQGSITKKESYGNPNIKSTPQNTSVPKDPKKNVKVVNIPSPSSGGETNSASSGGGASVNPSGSSGAGSQVPFPPSHNGVSYAAVETQSQMNLVMAD